MSIRIGADVGGTFTDIVIEVADGSYSSTKVLTTHDAPEVGILDGIGRIAAQENIDLRDVTQIIHGTTLATNALIERRGARDRPAAARRRLAGAVRKLELWLPLGRHRVGTVVVAAR